MGLEENLFGGVSVFDGGLRVAFGNMAQPFQEARFLLYKKFKLTLGINDAKRNVIFVFGVVDAESKKDPSASQWASNVGWFLAVLALVQIPLWFIIEVYKNPHTGIVKKFVNALKPADTWGPSDPLHNIQWREQKNARHVVKIPKQRRTNRFNLLKQWLQRRCILNPRELLKSSERTS
ncbi:sodium-dependent nutrient amino acid transporter 1 [Caerostris extrusa]|uniref:Sodium-dependent nutrient amino acid transporter 1 n=1 Tax=Caerostris extrusa TaxID=172846 RepID=A0AAV4P7P5_CAEEX|nr:sodium-dependent nutrient amino acid transporter 1 [Caerostris extrusa]